MTDDKLRIVEATMEGDDGKGLTDDCETVQPDAEDELTRLRNRVKELEYENTNLAYENGGLNDAARLNTAAAILAQVVGDLTKGEMVEFSVGMDKETTQAKATERWESRKKACVELSIELADSMVTHYTDIMNDNAIEYQRLLSLQGREPEGGEN